MKDNLTTFKIWAPDNALWTAWAKPVMFVHPPKEIGNPLTITAVDWVSSAERDTMIVVDRPGDEGVREGLALARLGYRPVPLYNGVAAPTILSRIVRVEEIVSALYQGADELATLRFRPDAPPAFLLDSNRMKSKDKQPGKYDNRWCVFPQDMPSASFLQQKGIQKIIVSSDRIRDDLSHVLCRYQEKGIKIYLRGEDCPLKETVVAKPSRFRSLIYRFIVIAGLTRNAAGGFGGIIPEPSSSRSG